MSIEGYGQLLSEDEISVVSGGNSIIEELEDRFPGGVWIDGSFYPNGPPSTGGNYDPTWP